jgi:TRAP-type C4-dicarboxylate transport system permease small subunit
LGTQFKKRTLLTGKKPIRADYWIAAILLLAMAVIAFVNILSRYFIHFSIGATEEITINLFVWMTVVGTGIAFERGAQLGMVTFFNLFPLKMRKALVVFSALLATGLFVLVCIYMVQAIYDELTLFKATSAALGIPVWIYYAGVPLCAVFVFRGIFRGTLFRLAALKGEGT